MTWKRLSYANVIATLAFFFALTGTAVATGRVLMASDPIPESSDLAGTFGNPMIGDGKVTNGKIADGAITSAKFASSAKAPDADKLDGVDSTSFLSGREEVDQFFDVSTEGATVAAVIANCPAGKVVVGGGIEGEVSSPGAIGTSADVIASTPDGAHAWLGEMAKPDRSGLQFLESFDGQVYAICASGGA